MDLRCDGTLHGRMTEEGRLEVKCHQRRCGYEKGVVVLHIFDLTDGKFVTKLFREVEGVNTNADLSVRTSVRST